MERRTFLTMVPGSLLAVPLAAGAQPAAKVYRIGWLAISPPTSVPTTRSSEAFLQGLRDHGFVEGQNVIIERRYSEGREDSHTAFVAEFIQMKVDLIVAPSSAAAHAAKQATKMIPIVMLAVASPEREGLVVSLGRPGGNVTGTSTQFGGELSGKMLQLLKETVPKLSKVAILWNPDNLGSAVTFREGEIPAAKGLGVAPVSLEVRGPGDVDHALTTMASARPDALWVHIVGFPFRARLLEFAATNRLPTVAQSSIWPQFGGLLSYGPDNADLFRRGAALAAKILKGAKPADLPIEQPTKFELVINLKTARALGLAIPPSLLARADQVIE
ncbi:MAG TPA: ABC transporter substrate-binding protein [Methylomirabilota bacterium]|nr:ABC transporter substrate-binding protein [Methylomirabilota bacterium]